MQQETIGKRHKATLKARLEAVQAANERAKTVNNEIVTQIQRAKGYSTVPPERFQHNKRPIETPDNPSIDRKALVPPVRPFGYAVKARKQELEKALTELEYFALARYVYNKIEARYAPRTEQQEGVVDHAVGHKLPYSMKQETAMAWVRVIEAGLAPEHVRCLELLVEGCIGETPFDAEALGRRLTRSKDGRQAIGGYKAYFKAIAEQILKMAETADQQAKCPNW